MRISVVIWLPVLLAAFVISMMITSCRSEQRFDKSGWGKVGDLMTFPNRNSMVNNLLEAHKLQGKRLTWVTDLLGKPQYPLNSKMEIGYKIDEKYGNDIDPVYSKTLLIRFNGDTVVKDVKVFIWEKH